MSNLFRRNKSVISRHIENIFDDKELERKMVVADFATTTKHGTIERVIYKFYRKLDN